MSPRHDRKMPIALHSSQAIGLANTTVDSLNPTSSADPYAALCLIGHPAGIWIAWLEEADRDAPHPV